MILLVLVAVSVPALAGPFDRLGGSVAVASNYTFRGINRYHHNRTLYGYVEYASEQGPYAGVWLGRYRPAWSTSPDTERDLYAGFNFATRSFDEFDLSVWRGSYERRTVRDYEWTEFMVRYTHRERWGAILAVADNLYGSEERSLVTEVSFTHQGEHLSLTLALGAHHFEAALLSDIAYLSARLALNRGRWHLFLDGALTELTSTERFFSSGWQRSTAGLGLSYSL